MAAGDNIDVYNLKMDHSYFKKGDRIQGFQVITDAWRSAPDHSYVKEPPKTPKHEKRKRAVSTPIGTTPQQLSKQILILDESIKHVTWSEEEKRYLRDFKGQRRLEGESETKFWARCASAMNAKDPDKKRTGNSCKSAARRMCLLTKDLEDSADSFPSLDSIGQSGKKFADIAIQTDWSFPASLNKSQPREGEWVFVESGKTLLKIHREVQGAEQPYACSICQKGFKQAAQMKNHLALRDEFKLDSNRTGDGDRWHTPTNCDICERTFVNAKCLKKHKEILHTQNKPFKCRYCDHECSRKAMMILHERIHTGEKTYKCNLCHYSCGDHNALRRHKMQHTGQKPYKCPHCPYACIQVISLKGHIKNKHPGMGGIYNCSMCLYRTVNLQQYENHQKDHKNGLIENTVENADGLESVKLSVKQNKSKNLLEKQEITTITLPQSISNFQTQTVSMQNMSLPQIEQIPASALSGIEQSEPFEMQIVMKEDGSHVIASENGNQVSGEEVAELSKITGYDGIVLSDMAAAQSIYSAPSAISQNSQGDNSQVVAGVKNGDIQTSIETDSSQGVTTDTITSHLPEGEELSGQGTVAEQVQKDSL